MRVTVSCDQVCKRPLPTVRCVCFACYDSCVSACLDDDGGRTLGLLPRSDFIPMSGTIGDWERVCELILEDNDTLNRIMAEPQGTARHLVAEDGKYPRVSQWQTLRENLSLATAAAVIAAASEEVAHREEDTVSQWQTCLESDGVDRDYPTSRVTPKDGFLPCGTPPQAKEPPILDPETTTPTHHYATGVACIRSLDAARVDVPPGHTATGTSTSDSACKSIAGKPTAPGQTEPQMDGDYHHGSCLKNINQGQAVEYNATSIPMDELVKYFVTTPVSMRMCDSRTGTLKPQSLDEFDFDRADIQTGVQDLMALQDVGMLNCVMIQKIMEKWQPQQTPIISIDPLSDGPEKSEQPVRLCLVLTVPQYLPFITIP